MNYYLKIGENSFHLGRSCYNWKFEWDLRSILRAVLTYLPFSSEKRQQLEEISKTLEVEFAQTGNEHFRTQDLSSFYRGGQKYVGMRVSILGISENEFLGWLKELGKNGNSLVSIPVSSVNGALKENPTLISDITGLISYARSRRGYDTYDHWRMQRNPVTLLTWNYLVGSLSCSPIENFS